MQDRNDWMIQKRMSYQDNINQSFASICMILFFALAASFCIEMIGKIQPCRICNLQRISYFFIAVLAFTGVFLRAKKVVGSMILLLSIASISIACYHIGIQVGLLSDSCSTITPNNLNDFKNMLFQSPPSCSSIHKIFRIPISALNLLTSSACLIIMTVGIRSSQNTQNHKKRIQNNSI